MPGYSRAFQEKRVLRPDDTHPLLIEPEVSTEFFGTEGRPSVARAKSRNYSRGLVEQTRGKAL